MGNWWFTVHPIAQSNTKSQRNYYPLWFFPVMLRPLCISISLLTFAPLTGVRISFSVANAQSKLRLFSLPLVASLFILRQLHVLYHYAGNLTVGPAASTLLGSSLVLIDAYMRLDLSLGRDCWGLVQARINFRDASILSLAAMPMTYPPNHF